MFVHLSPICELAEKKQITCLMKGGITPLSIPETEEPRPTLVRGQLGCCPRGMNAAVPVHCLSAEKLPTYTK